VRVLEQQQVVVVAVAEQATLQGVGVGVADPPEPPDAQRPAGHSSAAQSRVSSSSFTRCTKADA